VLQGYVKDEDIMVLKLDVLDYGSHEAAVQRVLDKFKQVLISIILNF